MTIDEMIERLCGCGISTDEVEIEVYGDRSYVHQIYRDEDGKVIISVKAFG